MSSIAHIYRFRTADGTVAHGTLPSGVPAGARVGPGDQLDLLDGSPTEVAAASLKRTGGRARVAELLPPVAAPNVYCIGLNYRLHWEEGAKKRGVPCPTEPNVFMSE